MTLPEFSGRTTCIEHKDSKGWEKVGKNHGRECVQDFKVLDVQWSNCPVEIENEVRKMWQEYELGNNNCYVRWAFDDMEEVYPLIAAFLRSKGLSENNDERILIHWWW